MLGHRESPTLAGSRWADARHGHRGGRLAPLDAARHLAVSALVRELVASDLLAGVHDIGDGGVGLALAEMAVRSGVGFRIHGVAGHGELFAEGPSRVVACVTPDRVGEVAARAEAVGVPLHLVGVAGGDRLVVEGLLDVGLPPATRRWNDSLPSAMAAARGH